MLFLMDEVGHGLCFGACLLSMAFLAAFIPESVEFMASFLIGRSGTD